MPDRMSEQKTETMPNRTSHSRMRARMSDRMPGKKIEHQIDFQNICQIELPLFNINKRKLLGLWKLRIGLTATARLGDF